MKKNILIIAALGVFFTAFVREEDPNQIEARKIVKKFFTQLSGELKTSMQEGGPQKALEVCKIKAPEIADQLSAEFKWEIGRTSLKPRNQNNTPSEWEESILRLFEERKNNGEETTKLEHSEIIEIEGEKYFRYMKAIPTSALCITCHGERISDKLQTKLDELYPDDEAVGFNVGDLRGAFTLSKVIE